MSTLPGASPGGDSRRTPAVGLMPPGVVADEVDVVGAGSISMRVSPPVIDNRRGVVPHGSPFTSTREPGSRDSTISTAGAAWRAVSDRSLGPIHSAAANPAAADRTASNGTTTRMDIVDRGAARRARRRSVTAFDVAEIPGADGSRRSPRGGIIERGAARTTTAPRAAGPAGVGDTGTGSAGGTVAGGVDGWAGS